MVQEVLHYEPIVVVSGSRSPLATRSSIGYDELAHAELSHAVARWANGRLNAAARARVAEAQREALDALAKEARCEPDPDVARAAGLPSGAEAALLVAHIRARVEV